MFIEEVPNYTGISIHVKTEAGEADLSTNTIAAPTQAHTLQKHVLYAEKILQDGKVVQPNDITQHYTAYWFNEATHRVMKWEPVTFRLVTVQGRQFYVILCNSSGVETNRRAAFRVEVCLQTVVQIGENRKTYECYVHDLSATGFSLNMTIPVDVPPNGLMVSSVFADEESGDKFRLTGKCVRYTEISHNVWRIGCMLIQPNALLAQYVNRRQIMLLKKR